MRRGLLHNANLFVIPFHETVAEQAIKCADALLKELKK